MEGSLTITSPDEAVWVRTDAHSLLQVLLNLSRNSIRAVTGRRSPSIGMEVLASREHVQIRFRDSGPGVAEPELLFQPFQATSESTGLGLYVSRAILRSFGGELFYEPAPEGSCFVIQLRRVHSGKTTSHDNGGEKANPRPHHRRPYIVSRRVATTA
jgi:C4-dicarboxylate-specific signal transduction histidine kinase